MKATPAENIPRVKARAILVGGSGSTLSFL